ncbi:helix-turn-helix domain-containing protein [Micropruina sp.]|uniref:helix-turn-helix domain-containing protein n=1 Tax=Micropruina sp. TaxID=2737536 RepID=UPI0039E6B638
MAASLALPDAKHTLHPSLSHTSILSPMEPEGPSNTPRGAPHLRLVGEPEDAQQTVHIGAAVKARREAVGLTQERAAALAGITRNALRNIEKAPLPNTRLSTLLALMRAYHLRTLDELLGPTAAEVAAKAWCDRGWEGGTPNPLPGAGG